MSEICNLPPFLYDQVPQPEDATGLQLSQEQLQAYLERMRDALCTDITTLEQGGGGGGASTFLGLTDTPSSYSGQSLLGVRVNAGETALEFATITATETEGLTIDYSTSEQTAPRTWFLSADTIYQKSINFGAMPNATTKNVAHSITNLDKILRHEFWIKRDSDGTQAPVPLVNDTALTSSIQLTANATNISCRTGANYSAWNGRLTIWYTRT